MSVQQQQAEQMKMYWKVCLVPVLRLLWVTLHQTMCSSSKACSQILARCHWIEYKQCLSLRLATTALWNNLEVLWKLLEEKA
jgi:hypothetical protein